MQPAVELRTVESNAGHGEASGAAPAGTYCRPASVAGVRTSTGRTRLTPVTGRRIDDKLRKPGYGYD
jgi:hypothetical protein